MRLTTYSGDSHLVANESVRPFGNLRIDLSWVLAISLVLSACGSSEPPATAPPTGTVATPAPAAAPVPAPIDAKTSLTLANAAFRQNRIVAPAGDNALEHTLNALRQDPENAGANEILVDLTPIAAAAIEAEIAAGNLVEAERVMALLSSANPSSLIVKGLQRRLATAARVAASQVAPATTAPVATSPSQAPVAAEVAPAPVTPPTEREAVPAPASRDTRVVSTPPRSQPETVSAPASTASEPVAANTTTAAVSAPPAAPPPSSRPSARTSEPIPLVKVQPDYPPAAKKRRTEGWVELQFLVGVDGVPKQIEVIRAQPAGMFDRAAIRAMSRWKFKPAERDGQPVEARAKTTVGFKLG